jgi:hypothetical protein
MQNICNGYHQVSNAAAPGSEIWGSILTNGGPQSAVGAEEDHGTMPNYTAILIKRLTTPVTE